MTGFFRFGEQVEGYAVPVLNEGEAHAPLSIGAAKWAVAAWFFLALVPIARALMNDARDLE